MTVVDSSADEPTQQQHGWSDGSSTDTVREQEPSAPFGSNVWQCTCGDKSRVWNEGSF